MSKRTIPVIVIVLILIIIAISISTNTDKDEKGISSSGGKPVGGDTDEHGCYLMAGYTWNETDQMCVREWEKVQCEEADREKVACTANYDPVCGLPIKQTFSNSCSACQNSEILYYVPNECLE
jgi:hypothetical protein